MHAALSAGALTLVPKSEPADQLVAAVHAAADGRAHHSPAVQEALDAALAVGDFDESNPGHHGTPEQREEAWNSGFESGDPSSCDQYLQAA